MGESTIPKSRRGNRHARGYDSRHVHTRKQLLYRHVDGTPCWWCGQAMYRDRTKNPDFDPKSTDPGSGALHADHVDDEQASRLLHERCNKSRGDGSRDHLRPALRLNELIPYVEPSEMGFEWV